MDAERACGTGEDMRLHHRIRANRHSFRTKRHSFRVNHHRIREYHHKIRGPILAFMHRIQGGYPQRFYAFCG